MRKVILLLTVSLLSVSFCFAQFSLEVFPTIVTGDRFGDTIINSRALMIKEEIRKIFVYQTKPSRDRPFVTKTMNYNKEGNIESVDVNMGKFKDLTLIINDTIFYDNQHRMIKIKTTDTKGNVYPGYRAEYISNNIVKFSSFDQSDPDTLFTYKYFNEIGQVIREKDEKGKSAGFTNFYYNKDGLYDSVKYENSSWVNLIFRRNEKRKKRIIEVENGMASIKWIYNLSGQCLSFELTRKSIINSAQPKLRSATFKSGVNYYYNLNGTIAKVIEKRSDLPTTIIYYAYSK